MSWDDLIEYNRRWVELHRDNGHQAEAARRMTAMIDAMTYLRTDKAVERLARLLACLEPGDEWPSNEALGGNLTGTRDHEYRDGMREQAREAIDALLGED